MAIESSKLGDSLKSVSWLCMAVLGVGVFATGGNPTPVAVGVGVFGMILYAIGWVIKNSSE